MADLCTACLCAGRKLFFIGETDSYHLYTQILNEISIYELTMSVRVCWECRARLRRFGQFKALVKASYSTLLQYHHQSPSAPAESLAAEPRLRALALPPLALPHLVLKEEPVLDQDLDGELEVEIDQKPVKEERDHSEPEAEAFVEDAPPKRKRRRNVKKTDKENSKKKLKSKSKKLEEKKINMKKKAEDSISVSSADSMLFICDVPDPPEADETDHIPDEEEDALLEDIQIPVDVELSLEEEARPAVKVRRLVVLPKKGETKVKRRAGKRVPKGVEPVAKPNGIPPAERPRPSPEPEPQLAGGKPTCGDCGKVFSSKKTYRYHRNVLHKGQNRYPCPRCGKVYQWKSNLGRHMRTHKARDDGELYCSLCDKSFASVATYRQHLRGSRRHVPESEFSFTCQECGKKFVSKTRLRDHIDWEHLNKIKFRCSLCNKPFKCHTSLYVHTQNVHRNKGKDNLCHICGKSYQNAAKLKYHIVAMHTSETPYRCAQCAAAFGWYSSLYRHVREVHYKMKLQPKKMRKTKRPNEILPPLPPHDLGPPPHM